MPVASLFLWEDRARIPLPCKTGWYSACMEEAFGPYLRRLRQARRMSQRELAERVGVTFPYISKIENGRVPPPNAGTLIRIAAVLAVDPDEMLVRAGKPPPDLVHRLSTDLALVKRLRTLID